VGLGLVLALAAGCGGGGTSLEGFVDEADAVCAEAGEDLDDLDLDSPSGAAADGEEAVDVLEEALDELAEVERPGGDDGELADGVVDAVEARQDADDALAGAAADEDGLAFVAVAADAAEDLDDAREAADDAGSDDCADVVDDGADRAADAADLLDEIGEPLRDVRVDSCVALDELGAVTELVDDCEGADARVVATFVEEGPVCDDGIESSHSVPAGDRVALVCMEPLGGAPGAVDGFFELGSCATISAGETEGNVTVSEVACDDPAATHEVATDVGPDEGCPAGNQGFGKSEEEAAETGAGFWCGRPL
jgi:hypothetical protein